MRLPDGTKLALAWIGGARFANRICKQSIKTEEKDEKEKEGKYGKD